MVCSGGSPRIRIEDCPKPQVGLALGAEPYSISRPLLLCRTKSRLWMGSYQWFSGTKMFKAHYEKSDRTRGPVREPSGRSLSADLVLEEGIPEKIRTEEAAEARHKVEVLGRRARSQGPREGEEDPRQGSLLEDPEEEARESTLDAMSPKRQIAQRQLRHDE